MTDIIWVTWIKLYTKIKSIPPLFLIYIYWTQIPPLRIHYTCRNHNKLVKMLIKMMKGHLCPHPNYIVNIFALILGAFESTNTRFCNAFCLATRFWKAFSLAIVNFSTVFLTFVFVAFKGVKDFVADFITCMSHCHCNCQTKTWYSC